MTDSHILRVFDVTPPSGPLDDGRIVYELEHPASCPEETDTSYGVPVTMWGCAVGYWERELGIAAALRYSGTPAEKPGTYAVEAWDSRIYVPDYGAYEYDGGLCLADMREGRTSDA